MFYNVYGAAKHRLWSILVLPSCRPPCQCNAPASVVVTGFKRLTIDTQAENMYRPIGG